MSTWYLTVLDVLKMAKYLNLTSTWLKSTWVLEPSTSSTFVKKALFGYYLIGNTLHGHCISLGIDPVVNVDKIV